jgi:hypothetical protein
MTLLMKYWQRRAHDKRFLVKRKVTRVRWLSWAWKALTSLWYVKLDEDWPFWTGLIELWDITNVICLTHVRVFIASKHFFIYKLISEANIYWWVRFQEAIPAVIRFGENAGIVVDSADTIKVTLPERNNNSSFIFINLPSGINKCNLLEFYFLCLDCNSCNSFFVIWFILKY